MRSIWTIARNHLLISVKERDTLIFGLLMPGVMMLLLGLAMGGANVTPTIRIDVIDEDGSALSARLVDLLRDETADDDEFIICPYHGDAPDDCELDDDLSDQPDTWRDSATERLEDTDAYAAVFIEAGFGERLRAGEPVTVYFMNDEELSAPTLAQQKIDAAISRMGGAVTIANLVIDVAREELDAEPDFDTVLATAESAWERQPVRVESVGTKERPSTMGFNQSGPGVAIMFVFISMLNASAALIYEREQGTLQRLFTLPVARWQVIAGKVLGHYVFGVANFGVLIGVGLMMGVEWGSNVIGIVLVVLIFTLTATALGLALATVVRTSAQASNISLMMGLILSPLGGAWWPLEIVPDFMKLIGHVSPVAWAMDAFQEMMFYDGGVVDIVPMLAVLLGMAVVCFGFAVRNFEYE